MGVISARNHELDVLTSSLLHKNHLWNCVLICKFFCCFDHQSPCLKSDGMCLLIIQWARQDCWVSKTYEHCLLCGRQVLDSDSTRRGHCWLWQHQIMVSRSWPIVMASSCYVHLKQLVPLIPIEWHQSLLCLRWVLAYPQFAAVCCYWCVAGTSSILSVVLESDLKGQSWTYLMSGLMGAWYLLCIFSSFSVTLQGRVYSVCASFFWWYCTFLIYPQGTPTLPWCEVLELSFTLTLQWHYLNQMHLNYMGAVVLICGRWFTAATSWECTGGCEHTRWQWQWCWRAAICRVNGWLRDGCAHLEYGSGTTTGPGWQWPCKCWIDIPRVTAIPWKVTEHACDCHCCSNCSSVFFCDLWFGLLSSFFSFIFCLLICC